MVAPGIRPHGPDLRHATSPHEPGTFSALYRDGAPAPGPYNFIAPAARSRRKCRAPNRNTTINGMTLISAPAITRA
ncbi:hypothetical protein GCM10010309_15540 [Streptomyces violaceochromogenes]|nr:hypothetical protein GCM10010309_15540 [Streptomyces violaceochromogenes]